MTGPVLQSGSPAADSEMEVRRLEYRRLIRTVPGINIWKEEEAELSGERG